MYTHSLQLYEFRKQKCNPAHSNFCTKYMRTLCATCPSTPYCTPIALHTLLPLHCIFYSHCTAYCTLCTAYSAPIALHTLLPLHCILYCHCTAYFTLIALHILLPLHCILYSFALHILLPLHCILILYSNCTAYSIPCHAHFRYRTSSTLARPVIHGG